MLCRDRSAVPGCDGGDDGGDGDSDCGDSVRIRLAFGGREQAQLDAGLLSAAKGNDLPGACEYLRRGADVDARESDYKRTALMIAANDGFLDLAKLLHANGSDVNLHGGSHDGGLYGRGWSALMYAAVAGNVEIARLLLDAGAEIESVWDGGGKTALWEASYWGRPGIVELLLSRGADVLGGPGDLSGIRAAVRETTVNYPYTRTMLSYYYPKPSADSLLLVVSLLAAGGAELNERRRGGRSILDEAVNRNNARVAKVLRQFGGKCFLATGPLCGVAEAVTSETVCESGSLSANGQTQAQLDAGLISAAEDNDLEGACEYLRKGANIEVVYTPAIRSGDAIERTPLVIAAVNDRLELSRLLLNNGANVDWQSGRTLSESVYDGGAGWSALALAAAAGHGDMVGLLLDQGANVDIQWDFGRTALHEAAIFGRASVVELLLARGAAVDVRDLNGETALHGAAWGASPGGHHTHVSRSTWEAKWDKALDLLLDAGAEVNLRSTRTSDWGPAGRVFVNEGWNGGWTPLDRAVAANKRSRALKLRARGGVCNVQSGPLCPSLPVTVAVTMAVTIVASTVVTAETICESGSLSANGQTQAQLDAGLVSAAKANDLTSACDYLRRGADVETREATPFYGGHRRTPLMIAANLGFVDVAGLLLGNGANVNRQVIQYSGTAGGGWSALHYASGAGHQDMAEYLLDQGADVGAKWSWGRSVLFEASFYAHWETVELLLSRGADVGEADAEGLTPLHAVGYGEGALFPSGELRRSAADGARVVALLLDAGADVNARGLTSGRKSPLDVAVSRHRLSQSATLRAAGGYCYVQTSSLCAYPPVVTAVTLAVTTTVTSETVCESGSLSANGQTQAQLDAGLVSAAKANDLTSACDYLRRGADVETREATPFYGGHRRTPLMIAANLGFVDVAGLLLGNGANVNRQVIQYSGTAGGGWSALHYASGAGHQDMAEYLLDQGADVGAKWSWGRSVLFEASFYAHWETVELLLSRGADVGEADAEGLTPLHAVGYGEGALFPSGELRRSAADGARVVALLLDAGADVNARGLTSGRKSPLDVAVSRHRLSQSATLRAAGGYCYVQTSSLCAYPPVVTAVTLAVTTTVTSETVCESGSLSANGQTQAQLDAGLVSAAKGNDLAKVCEWLRRGADVEAEDAAHYSNDQRTPLIAAAANGRLEIARLLLANGADVNILSFRFLILQ